jgi:hypothetical protein
MEDARERPGLLGDEQEILGELRRQGIVVWLDKDASYTHFVEGLTCSTRCISRRTPIQGSTRAT